MARENFRKAMADYKEMTETGNLGKLKPYDVNCIWFVLTDIYGGDASGTLSENVKAWFEGRGFFVEKTKSGIGWTIREEA